jgi:hypothetical protein
MRPGCWIGGKNQVDHSRKVRRHLLENRASNKRNVDNIVWHRLTSVDLESGSEEEPSTQQAVEQGLVEFVVRPVDNGRFRNRQCVWLGCGR